MWEALSGADAVLCSRVRLVLELTPGTQWEGPPTCQRLVRGAEGSRGTQPWRADGVPGWLCARAGFLAQLWHGGEQAIRTGCHEYHECMRLVSQNPCASQVLRAQVLAELK